MSTNPEAERYSTLVRVDARLACFEMSKQRIGMRRPKLFLDVFHGFGFPRNFWELIKFGHVGPEQLEAADPKRQPVRAAAS